MTCGCSSSGNGCGNEIEFFAGDYPWVFQYQLTLDGAPVDLTGLSMILLFKVSPTDDDGEAVHEVIFPVPDGADAQAGLVAVILGTSDISALPPTTYFLKTKTSAPGSPNIVQTYGDPIQVIVSP